MKGTYGVPANCKLKYIQAGEKKRIWKNTNCCTSVWKNRRTILKIKNKDFSQERINIPNLL